MTTETEDDSSLQADMAAAISELEAKGTSTTEAVEKLEPTKQERSEDGKFKPKTEEKGELPEEPVKEEKPADKPAEPVKAEAQPLGQDPVLTQDKAPSSWTPKARESWAALPEDARKEILRREEDSVKGIRQLQEQMAPYTQFAGSLQPFIQEAIDNKADPGQYIGNVMAAERRLRSGTAEQRFSALVEIAEGYGIPLRKVINDAMGQEVIPHPSLAKQQNSLPPEIQQELAESRKFREQFNAQQTNSSEEALKREIAAFRVDKEFFDDVSEDMGVLLEAGRATDLKDAYEKACRMNSGVHEIIQERASKPALGDKQKAAAKLKGTSSNSAETGNSDFDDDDDLATTVRKAASAASGRI